MNNDHGYDGDEQGLGLDDTERLPWLETADDYEYDSGPSSSRIIGLLLAGLAMLAAIIGGIYWWQRNQNAQGGIGNGDLIVAQEGDYKVKAEDPQGKSFEGEGDAAYAASDGRKLPTGAGPEKENMQSPTAKAGVNPSANGNEPAKGNAAANGASNNGGASGAMVQLGAFSDSASAQNAWSGLSSRFGFLSSANRKIVEGKVDNGRKIFRLQAGVGNAAQAQDICAKLRAAGENCLVVR
ncbi:hypothetical protein LPB140_09520 [Sphingorhabdus lutea]|uniref:SPOR domain-containing protein n=2 Tax=Sphingorhabdus lutea TaxID=1913578 RepID=A0A1L3JF55_9SPHN|nr:hypothetical protein LPB140_09520 [Sphingorhabdus lutea]